MTPGNPSAPAGSLVPGTRETDSMTCQGVQDLILEAVDKFELEVRHLFNVVPGRVTSCARPRATSRASPGSCARFHACVRTYVRTYVLIYARTYVRTYVRTSR